MNTHTDKTQENKSQSVANSVSLKQSRSRASFRFVDNRPEAIAQRKLKEVVNSNIQLKGIVQRKTDHLFNDIPKTLRGLPKPFQRPGLDSIRQQLDTIRNKSGNKKDNVHTGGGADANSFRYGMASASFVKAVEEYGKGNINEGHLRIVNYTLWKESTDDEVASSLGTSVRSDIDSWKALEKPTYEQLGKHF